MTWEPLGYRRKYEIQAEGKEPQVFKKKTPEVSYHLHRKKILRFYLHENVQLISFVYSKMICIHGAELADGDLIFLFLLERV